MLKGPLMGFITPDTVDSTRPGCCTVLLVVEILSTHSQRLLQPSMRYSLIPQVFQTTLQYSNVPYLVGFGIPAGRLSNLAKGNIVRIYNQYLPSLVSTTYSP
jgi:hypothetical protein